MKQETADKLFEIMVNQNGARELSLLTWSNREHIVKVIVLIIKHIGKTPSKEAILYGLATTIPELISTSNGFESRCFEHFERYISGSTIEDTYDEIIKKLSQKDKR